MLGLENWDMDWEGLFAIVGSIGATLWGFWMLSDTRQRLKED